MVKTQTKTEMNPLRIIYILHSLITLTFFISHYYQKKNFKWQPQISI